MNASNNDYWVLREEVPRIWEGEGSWRSEIMNASNNDSITLLSFDLQRNYYIKNVVLIEENSILPLPERGGFWSQVCLG